MGKNITTITLLTTCENFILLCGEILKIK